MTAIDFGRVITAMVTPFNADLSVNYAQAKKLSRYLVENGSDGLVVCGTTGESPTLSKEEKINLCKAVVEEVGGQATVIAGTGSYDTAGSIALTKEAEKVGCDGVMLVAPYYNKPSQEGLYRHFRAVAESTSLPVILYNIPGRTGINVLPSTVARLAKDVPNIAAIKEAAGNIDQVSELRSLLPEDFAIYSGDDSMTLPMLSLGAKGVISVAAHVAGKQIQAMIDAYTSGNTTLAANMHKNLYPLFKGLFITTNPVPVKAALNLKGFAVGGVRLPLVEATGNEIESVKNVMQNTGLL
ncbi:4-hydroxy-tetrahydrodipicolinate synthase [Desulforamulus hydrothermalis]|uniref:4-hydroxy-tetrahydrodipicolinate synthase n=1 Tax=Desulforamulus hydrothermalis Lam5 = DSM 18033 TaxID=1121428 RepID=K8E182_9FIRM|nr:4-hydroxy-tetrahydrodipicolinate synthase [Desulforamulus hydrothermalis]CCO09405.1 putative lyase/synthase; CP4-6 prophage [Desulforamulus hydrothermalis Lam5 = DSM 18033]SHH08833.1 dihydrodipicolinate synthase [Desulforamulus hydrothermalis Lam5 = DSM 18033]